MKIGYLAVEAYGEKLMLTKEKHPRKQLLEKLGRKHTGEKMFVDLLSGGSKHIGYVIGREWWTIYEVHSWGKEQKPKGLVAAFASKRTMLREVSN